jgi:hypothetical protein
LRARRMGAVILLIVPLIDVNSAVNRRLSRGAGAGVFL